MSKEQQKGSIINTLKLDQKGTKDKGQAAAGSQGREGLCRKFKGLRTIVFGQKRGQISMLQVYVHVDQCRSNQLKNTHTKSMTTAYGKGNVRLPPLVSVDFEKATSVS